TNGFTIYGGLSGIPAAYGPAADYVTLGPFFDYMSTTVSGLWHAGNITSGQQVLAGALSVGAYNNNLGPGPTNPYSVTTFSTVYYDNSGGALPTLPNALFGKGSIYITVSGQAFQNINGSWVGIGN